MKKVLCEVSPFSVENQSSVPLETSLKPLNTVGNLHQLSQLGVKKLGYLYSIYYSIPSWGLLQAPNLQQLHFARSSKQPSVGSVQQGGRRELSQDSPPFSPDCSPFPSSTFSNPSTLCSYLEQHPSQDTLRKPTHTKAQVLLRVYDSLPSCARGRISPARVRRHLQLPVLPQALSSRSSQSHRKT